MGGHKYDHTPHKEDWKNVRIPIGHEEVEDYTNTFPKEIYGHASVDVQPGGQIRYTNNKGTDFHGSASGAAWLTNSRGDRHTTSNHEMRYCKGGLCDTVEGTVDQLYGNVRKNVRGFSHTEVKDDMSHVTGGNASYVSGKGSNFSSKGPMTFKAEKGLNISGPGHSKAVPGLTMNENGDLHIRARKISFEASESMAFHSSKDTHFATGTNIWFGWNDNMVLTKPPVLGTNYPKEHGDYKSHNATETTLNGQTGTLVKSA